jgi:multidrug efflux system outer membrane protein
MHKSIAIAAAAFIAAPASILNAQSNGANSANSASSLDPSAFWQRVGDGVLTRLIGEAVRNGTTVRSAEARLDEARAMRRLAAFDLAPTVTATGSALRTRQSMAQVPGLTSPLPQVDLYDVGFDAAWEVDLFGRVRREVNAQNAFAVAAEHSLADVQVSLSAEVARTYFELRVAERQLAVALRNADVQRKTVALTEDRLAAGRGTAFDVERARSVLQLTLAAVPSIEAGIASMQFRIATLLGRTPDAVPAELVGDGALPQLPDSVPTDLSADIVHRRPDVLAAERQLAARSLAAGAAQADYLPRFSLGASTGYTANRIESLTRTGTSRVVFGPVVSFPLFDLGRVHQRVSGAQALAEEARTQYTAAVLQAGEESRSAAVGFNRARERVRLLDGAVESSRRALALAQQRFEAGLTDFLQVLDAQRTLLEAENQLAAAHTSGATAFVALYKATGGAWVPAMSGSR